MGWISLIIAIGISLALIDKFDQKHVHCQFYSALYMHSSLCLNLFAVSHNPSCFSSSQLNFFYNLLRAPCIMLLCVISLPIKYPFALDRRVLIGESWPVSAVFNLKSKFRLIFEFGLYWFPIINKFNCWGHFRHKRYSFTLKSWLLEHLLMIN